jgi:phosphatidylserine decarboxylase
LEEWVATDVTPVKSKPLKWLSEEHFFRDPCRPIFSDPDYFFSPADGIIIYQTLVRPDECILDIKGKPYSLRMAMQDETFDKPCLVVGIFMTMYDVHINRIPYAGFLSYKHLEQISTFNAPMLAIERSIIEDLTVEGNHAEYLHTNQRTINRICSPELSSEYYVLQVADYDVDCIAPFIPKQNAPVRQNQRFSQIRFGSQVDLIIPISERIGLELVQETGMHVEAGVDPLIKIGRTS